MWSYKWGSHLWVDLHKPTRMDELLGLSMGREEKARTQPWGTPTLGLIAERKGQQQRLLRTATEEGNCRRACCLTSPEK